MANSAQNEKDMVPDKKSTKKFLIIYCIAIFVFAVALILIAALSQQRIERDAAALAAKAENAEDLAAAESNRNADLSTLLDGAMTEITRLKNDITTLTSEKNELSNSYNSLTTQIAGLEQKQKASEALAKIVNYVRVGDDLSKQTAITAFEESGFPAILTPDEKAIYNSVK